MHGSYDKEKIKAKPQKIKQASARLSRTDKKEHKERRKQRKNRDNWED